MSEPNIDIYIGSKIRARRHILGMSQTELGQKIGVTFQQIQKYEKGFNKIVASRLFSLAGIMEVPITYFFEDLISDYQQEQAKALAMHSEQADFNHASSDEPSSREAISLVKIFNNISNRNVRKKLILFLKTLGSAD